MSQFCCNLKEKPHVVQNKQAGFKTHMHLHALLENESFDAIRQNVRNFHYLALTLALTLTLTLTLTVALTLL